MPVAGGRGETVGRESGGKRGGEVGGGREGSAGATNTYEKYPLHEWCTPTFRQPGDESEEGGMAGSRGRVDGERREREEGGEESGGTVENGVGEDVDM